jgi:hypothetical protein
MNGKRKKGLRKVRTARADEVAINATRIDWKSMVKD